MEHSKSNTQNIQNQVANELAKTENRKAMLKGLAYNLVILFSFTLHPIAGIFIAAALVFIYEALADTKTEVKSNGRKYFYGIALFIIVIILIAVLSYHALNGVVFVSNLHHSMWILGVI